MTPAQRREERRSLMKLQARLRAVKESDEAKDFFNHRVVGTFSRLFGNAVGSIQFRRGKLYGNAEIAQELKQILKPGDLLLEATPFRATSYFIPGHYGHVALWIGTSGELADL